ncbi:MAG: AraC family transcriptional regulator [Treponemataceae bacterium]
MRYLSFPIATPIPLVSCGNLINETAWIHKERIIDTFELIVGVRGNVYIRQDDEKHVVKPGSSLLLLPNHQHGGYAYSSQPISFYWVHFQLKTFSILDDEEGLKKLNGIGKNPYSHMSNQAVLPLFCDSVPDSKLDILFHQLLHLVSDPVYSTLAADYTLTSLLIQSTQNMLRSYNQNNKESANSSTFEKSLEWVRQNYTTNVSTKEVAARYLYNSNYYSKLFRAQTGMCLLEYINTLRISKAKTLLYQTEARVKEIANEIGFADEKYFMRVFKQIEGISPTQYRNAFYKTHLNQQ